MKVTLANGFTCELDETTLDDIEVFEDLVEIQAGNPAKFPGIAKMMIGEDGYKALKDHCRGENGRAKTSDVINAFTEIMKQAGDGKKK